MAPAEPLAETLSERELLAISHTAFHEAATQAWFASALEQTKSVFALASAGVGLALTLLFNTNTRPLVSWAPIWLLLSTLVFGIAAALSVKVFAVNVKVVGHLLKDRDSTADEAFVGRLHLTAYLMFGAGIVFLVFSAVSQIWL